MSKHENWKFLALEARYEAFEILTLILIFIKHKSEDNLTNSKFPFFHWIFDNFVDIDNDKKLRKLRQLNLGNTVKSYPNKSYDNFIPNTEAFKNWIIPKFSSFTEIREFLRYRLCQKQRKKYALCAWSCEYLDH